MAKTEKKAKPEQEAKKNAEPQAETPDTETAGRSRAGCALAGA